MEVVKELKRYNSFPDNDNFRSLEGVIAGDYIMSLQGSQGHYCKPRKTTDLDDYTEFELALFDSERNWLNIRKDNVIKAFHRYNDLLQLADGWTGRTEVFAYVPIDLLNDLYLYLSTK